MFVVVEGDGGWPVRRGFDEKMKKTTISSTATVAGSIVQSCPFGRLDCVNHAEVTIVGRLLCKSTMNRPLRLCSLTH